MTPEQMLIEKVQDEAAKKLIHAWFLASALNGSPIGEISLEGSAQIAPRDMGRCNLDYTISFTVNDAEVLEDEGL